MQTEKIALVARPDRSTRLPRLSCQRLSSRARPRGAGRRQPPAEVGCWQTWLPATGLSAGALKLLLPPKNQMRSAKASRLKIGLDFLAEVPKELDYFSMRAYNF